MTGIVDTKKDLEGLLKPFNSMQRQYIILLLAGFSRQEAVFALSRRPKTMDGYLVDPNFQEVAEFVLAHRVKYSKEATQLWEEQLGSKANLFLEAVIEKGLDEIHKKEKANNVLIKVATQAATTIRGKRSKEHEEPFSYDKMILERVRKIEPEGDRQDH